MPGGLIQLAAVGVEDIHLSNEPDISFFKVLYRRHTEFSTVDYPIKAPNNPYFGESAIIQLKSIGDLLHKLTLVVRIGQPIVKFADPIYEFICNLLEKYGINIKSFNIYDNDKVVTYNDVFRIDGKIHTILTNYALNINIEYNTKLHILHNIKDTFKINDDIYTGKYIAIHISPLLSRSISSYAKIYDVSGYIVLNHISTAMFVDMQTEVDITQTSFVMHDNVTRVFPEQLQYFVELTEETLSEFLNITSRKHIVVSSKFIKNKKQSIITELQYNIANDPDNFNLRKMMINEKNLNFSLGKWTIEMLINSDFIIGYFTLGSQYDTIQDNQYYDILDDYFRQTSIKIRLEYVDINPINNVFNRYTLRENAFCSQSFDIYDIASDGQDEFVYLLDITASSNVENIITLDPDEINIHVHPYYFYNNKEHYGFAPCTTLDKWEPSILQNGTKMANTNEKDIAVAVAPIIYSLYSPPTLNINNAMFREDTQNVITIVQNLHSFVGAARADLLENNTDGNKYKLVNIQTTNVVGVTNAISEMLISGIINVKQKMLANNFVEKFPLTFKVQDTNGITVVENEYHINTNGLDADNNTKHITYSLAKYIMWSYNLENRRTLLQNSNVPELSSMLLSYMRTYANFAMSDIRYTQNDIVRFNETYPYEDDTFIEQFMPTTNETTMTPGYINNEIAFYHKIWTKLQDINEHTLSNIEQLSDGTYTSFLLNQYVNTFKNMGLVLYAEVMQNIQTNISQNVTLGYILSVVSMVKSYFMLWRNFVYDDVEILPNNVINKNGKTISIDYDPPPIPIYGNDLANAFKTKAKYYCGINNSYRCNMLYYTSYNIDMLNSDTYYKLEKQYSSKINFGNILDIPAWLQCGIIERIIKKMMDLEITMTDLLYVDRYVTSSVPYIYWLDFNIYTTQALQRTVQDGSTNLAYIDNGFVLNHIPFGYTWYIGQSIQNIINLHPTLNFSIKNCQESTDAYMTNINAQFDTAHSNILSYMGTDVGLIGLCPFHGEITQQLENVFDQYIDCNCINQFMCPMCMRTYGFQKLFKELYENNIVSSDHTHIVDIDTITSADKTQKTMWLYRGEPITYDSASETLFLKLIDYCVARICTIWLRYANIIIFFSESEAVFNLWITSIMPYTADQLIMDRFENFKNYLTWLRDGQLDNFENAIEKVARFVCIGDNNNVDDVQIYEELVMRIKLIKTTIKSFADFVTVKNLGTNAQQNNAMVQNIVTKNESYKYMRYHFYTGNIKVYRYIQNSIIDSYNTYMNGVLKNGLEYQLFADINATTRLLLNTTDAHILFYKEQQVSRTKTFDEPSTVMINKLRHDIIYYDTLLARYEIRKKLFNTSNTINIDTSANIVKAYFSPAINTLNANIVHYDASKDTVANFYDIDVCPIYYSENANEIDVNNKFAIRTLISYHQKYNIMRQIGFVNSNPDYVENTFVWGLPTEMKLITKMDTQYAIDGYSRQYNMINVDTSYSLYGSISGSTLTFVDIASNTLNSTTTNAVTCTILNILNNAIDDNDIQNYFHTKNLFIWANKFPPSTIKIVLRNIKKLYLAMIADIASWQGFSNETFSNETHDNIFYIILKMLFRYICVSESAIPDVWPKTQINSTIDAFNVILNSLRKNIRDDLKKINKVIDLTRYSADNRQITDEFTNYNIHYGNAKNMGNIVYEKFLKEQRVDPDAVYVGSELYNKIVNFLFRQTPNHAWARYIGYKLIEHMELIADGQTIDSCTSELLLMTHRLLETTDQQKGLYKMIGHTKEIYEINRNTKPQMLLFIDFPLCINKYRQSNIPLVNMLYSHLAVRIKFRKLDELLYIEDDGILTQPIKFECNLLGRFVYLGNPERKIFATTRIEQLIERYVTTGKQVKTYADIIDGNVIKNRIYFTDPCKYILMRINVVDTRKVIKNDLLYWDISGYPKRNIQDEINPNVESDNVISRMLLEFNNSAREDWKDYTYYRTLQPLNKNVNGLYNGEYFYSFCLNPKEFQPSGSNNFSEINDFSILMEIKNNIVELLKSEDVYMVVEVWNCCYNVFVTMSGFGALKFIS